MKHPVIFGCLTAAFAVSGTIAHGADNASRFPTKYPQIKHLVVIFQENVSFDHYFATYPNAANTDGTTFYAAPGTYSVNNLATPLDVNNSFAPLPPQFPHQQPERQFCGSNRTHQLRGQDQRRRRHSSRSGCRTRKR